MFRNRRDGPVNASSSIFGRREMGETVRSLGLRDRWRLHRSGRLAHADDLAIAGAPPRAKAALDTAGAMANIVLLAPGVDTLLEPLRALGIAASAWNGKLVARLVAPDGFELRKSLIPALRVLARGRELPRVWTF